MTRRKIEVGAIGPDVDLDSEEVYTADGRRLTNELAAQIAEQTLARRRGRPSVSGNGHRTPSLTVRVPEATRAGLERIATARGRRLADVSREALEDYVARHSG